MGNIKKGTRMNANELADELWVCLESSIISDSDTRDLIMEAATMLRQQQTRIDQLIQLKNYLYRTHDKDKAQLVAAEQLCLNSFERGKQIGYAEGMMNRSNVQNNEKFTEHEQGKEMNALELSGEFNADNIFWNEDNLRHWGKEAATMLRQQQAVIKNLMDLVDIQKGVSRDVDIDFLNLTISQQQAEIEALKAKTLTNEEIARIFEEVYKYKASNLNMDFARAILRKANEK